MNENLNIEMSGEEFIAYDRIRHNRKTLNFNSSRTQGIFIIVVSLLSLLIIPLIHEWFNPPEPIKWGFSNLFGVQVHNGILIFLVGCIGLAWVLHGFGFIIVRR